MNANFVTTFSAPSGTTGAAPLDIAAIPAFRDNYIWLIRAGDTAVVVDPGDAVPVAAVLSREGLRLAAILITHHHADHQGGVVDLVRQWSPAVFGPAAESITGITHPLSGGERIVVPGLAVPLDVLAVPGHTCGHLAYLGAGCLFCGDTLFGAGCGRLFEGTPAQMAASLALIAALPGDTRIYCAHEYTAQNLRFAAAVEPDSTAIRERTAAVAEARERGEATVPSTLALEKLTNPFLRCSEPAVVAATRARGADGEAVNVFAALRAWRNDF